jgi:hypothetical protein
MQYERRPHARSNALASDLLMSWSSFTVIFVSLGRPPPCGAISRTTAWPVVVVDDESKRRRWR